MARKPKTQPNPDNTVAVPVPEPAIPDEAAVPARRGRKPKAQLHPDVAAALPVALAAMDDAPAPARRSRTAKPIAPSPEPSASGQDDPALSGVEADAPTAAPTKAPGRKGQGRKPKQAAGSEAAASIQDGATELQDQTPDQPEAKASLDLIEADVLAAAAASQVETAADSGPVSPASEAAQSVPEAKAYVPAKPAAYWDRTTDRVRFDWPAIEQAAAQDGPNQGMAKLLVAARAEGAASRWPL
jgi:hypothetical protein